MKPLTTDELKALKVGDWVWIKILKEERHYDLLDTGYYRKSKFFDNEDKMFDTGWHGFGNSFLYENYGTSWLAYKNKEQAEAKGEIVELPCIRTVDKGVRGVLYEVVSVQFSGTVQSETFSKPESAHERLAELKGDPQ